ncbi:hypothetical protein M378DRAFT_14941 [Amanita muscaria Koide BX008]|uniref:F-box domain-containing protein n=1 Tax=Amanita muscaria (strain Koide BX008) TaxID=946122 RepID=A0A0C2WD18_AMAMK|nr:hypothetical protein M378DRAFT_14941 [Amanita muscaria Koide BX008]
MAVVSTVPTELLTEIFYLLCKRPISVYKLNNSSCKEDFPWAVGLVCRQWRIAFLSYPPIWASLELSDSSYDSLNPEAHNESHAKEIHRRLALYLERSGDYPLRLDIFLWSDHNKAFTTMALEMLSACSHRWQTAKFNLETCGDWPLDSILLCKGNLPTLEWLEFSGAVFPKYARIFEVAPRLTHARIGPWEKSCGWVLPWTQLTELFLTSSGDFVIENGDVQNLLPMLHNIKELRFCFNCDEVDFEGGFPQVPPTPLNQLRILEVPHPAILSWFEAPSLCEIYFADYQQDYHESLDVHEHTSSLIQRSSCRIRKLSFRSGRKLYVGTLKDVEELVINYQHSHGLRSSIDISSLPKLRLFTIICWIDEDFESTMNLLTAALKSARVPTRRECSSGTPISLLERVVVELHDRRKEPKITKMLLEIVDKWPAVVFRT